MTMDAIAPWLLEAMLPHAGLLPPNPVPSQFEGAQLVTIPHANLRELVARYGRAFFEQASSGVAPLLLGAPGRYKSYAAALLATRIRDAALIPVGWCDCPVALSRFERNRYAAATDAQIEAWKVVPWLVLDDFGMVKEGTWQMGVLTEIAFTRFDRGLPTCWTGNVEIGPDPHATLVETVGAQLARRMWESSEGYRLRV
jgi:DNA replication protein DnaC